MYSFIHKIIMCAVIKCKIKAFKNCYLPTNSMEDNSLRKKESHKSLTFFSNPTLLIYTRLKNVMSLTFYGALL